MIENEFDRIVSGQHYPSGSESKVYVLPENICKPFGEPCVIKVYTHGAFFSTSKGPLNLESLANHELEIGIGLKQEGLAVPTMHRVVSFDSPVDSDHRHYLWGERVPAIVMSQLTDICDFEDLDMSARPKALRSFVMAIQKAMYSGFNPSADTCFDLNTGYDSQGNALLYDFSQWERGKPIGNLAVLDFLKGNGVLPVGICSRF